MINEFDFSFSIYDISISKLLVTDFFD